MSPVQQVVANVLHVQCVGVFGGIWAFVLFSCLLLEHSCLLIDREARPPGRPELRLRSCESMWVSGYVCGVNVCVGVYCDVVIGEWL